MNNQLFDFLTRREKEVADFLVVEPNYTKCAKYFCVERSTIKTQVDRIFRKLNVHSLAELVVKYYKALLEHNGG